MHKSSPIKALGMASSETMLVEPDSLDEQSETRFKLHQNIILTKNADLQQLPLFDFLITVSLVAFAAWFGSVDDLDAGSFSNVVKLRSVS